MRIAPLCFSVIVVLLLFAIVVDLGAITFGGLFTADSYYLPLRNIDVGNSRDAIESTIIMTHAGILTRKHGFLLVIHTIALVSALIAFWSTKKAYERSVS